MLGMNLINLVWPMMAATSLTLAVIFLFVWSRLRSQRDYLAFAVFAICVCAYTLGELFLMRAGSPGQYSDVLRLMMFVVPIGEISLAAFIRWHLKGGRAWLFWSICVLRAIGIPINFVSEGNLVFAEITALEQIAAFGDDRIAMPVGVLVDFHWLLNNLPDLLLLIFIVDTSISAWRHEDPLVRRRALLAGGGSAFFFLVAAGHATLFHLGVVPPPYLIGFCFLGIVLAMSCQLGFDVFRSVQLAIRLKESEQRTELAVHSAQLCLWEWDLGKDVFWANDIGYAMFAFTQGEHVNFARFLNRVHPEDRAAVSRAVTTAIEASQRYETTYRVLLPGGEIRWVQACGTVVRGADGQSDKMLGVVADITERKRSEARNREIEQAAAKQRDELAHLSRVAMLGELSGALAHELNQPLASILSNAQAAQLFLARGAAKLDELGPILNDIIEADRRAGDIIWRLRLMLKKEDSTREALDINEVVTDILRMTRSDTVARGIEILLELSTELPLVRGDKVQLQQVFLNLLNNACDAIEGGCEPLALTVRSVAGPLGVMVSVADRGTGISPDLADRIFDPFVTTKKHGMGLGLSICRTIMLAHGGKLWAEPRAGGGSVFCFSLPPLQG